MTRNVKLSLGLSMAGLLGVLVLLAVALNEPRAPRQTQLDVGGPFNLLDSQGRMVQSADFAGKPLLIYFGFTYCPDVCPTSLDLLGAALDILKTDAPQAYEDLQPLFISVDPARDTPPQMADYLSYFHPKIIGLTGSEAQINAVKKAYRVYAVRRPQTDPNGNYNVDHSSFFFLMDGDNRYLAHFDHGLSAELLARKLADKLAR